MQPRPWPKVPELTAQVARAVAARGPYPLAMRVRDELGELFADAEFAEAFGAREAGLVTGPARAGDGVAVRREPH
ncbi:hypothetical protein [Streptomyces sp. BE133]|uniref:hypothetical protein n=1 Tax=Streptomyces sp. BE133 TaxID=3002523 RepID=UPI002E795CF0|nr:hypothetical protein [Streptomyces sp. BE133]MEE1812885.1 hypothetical protein [Streptomyces sp. BE133]